MNPNRYRTVLIAAALLADTSLAAGVVQQWASANSRSDEGQSSLVALSIDGARDTATPFDRTATGE